MKKFSFVGSFEISVVFAASWLALTGFLAAQDGPFSPDAWPASAEGDKLVHFTTVDFSLDGLGEGWEETLTVLSGGDQTTEPITIGGFEGVKVTGTYLNIADFDYEVWADHETIDILLQIYGSDAVLSAEGDPREFRFLTGTLPFSELAFPVGGSIPLEGKNNKWNWVLFRIENGERPSGFGRHVGDVPEDAEGGIAAGGVNGGTIRAEIVPGLIVRAVAFGEEGAFGEPEQVNRFEPPEACAPEPATNHAFIDINSGANEHMEVLNNGNQTVSFSEGIGPDGDKRRAVKAEGRYLNFGVTDEYLGAACSEARAVKICIEYYDDPELAGQLFGPDEYATDNLGGTAFLDPESWQPARGTGEWVRQAYVIPAVSLFGVNTAPLTGGPRLSFDSGADFYISRFDLAVLRTGDHPLAGQDPLADCFEDPAVCAGEYGTFAEIDLARGVFEGLMQGTSGGDQVMIEEKAGPAGDRRDAIRAAHDDGPVGFAHNYINFAITDEVFGPSSQPNARLAICVTYWDNPDLEGATFRPEVYRSIREGVESFAFTPASSNVMLEGTDQWREAYWEIPDVRFSGVNQGPQAATRFISSDKIHISRLRYGVIRSCGPTANVNPLEECKPAFELNIAQSAEGLIRLSWPLNTSNWELEESADLRAWEPSAEFPFQEDGENVVEFPADAAPVRAFRLRQ